jgi:hypothetical protein
MDEHLEQPISPEQKLAILRNEMATPLAILRGHADMMRIYYEFNIGKPEEIMDWIQAIANAVTRLEELRNELV